MVKKIKLIKRLAKLHLHLPKIPLYYYCYYCYYYYYLIRLKGQYVTDVIASYNSLCCGRSCVR